MKTNNKFNFILVLLIALSIAIGCNLTDESAKNDSKNDEVLSTENDSENDGDTSITMDDVESDSDIESDKISKATPATNSKQTTVKFAKGKTSRSYEKAVIRGEKHTYYIGASKGQNMSIKVNSLEDNANFVVISPEGGYPIAGTEEEGIKSFNEVLEDSGKYKVIVTSTRGNATFKINFAISAKATKASSGNVSRTFTKIVKFGKGKSSATYKDSILRATSHTYVLGANSGQFINVRVFSDDSNAEFSIISPTGSRLANSTTRWSGTIPANGNYKVVVEATGGTAIYEVSMSITN